MVSLNFKNQNCQPIGLDIGHSSINMVQLSTNAERTCVLAAEKVNIDPGVNDDAEQRRKFVVSSISQMLTRGGFNGREVISSLSNEALHITSIRLPEMDETEIEKALRKEAQQRFGFDSPDDSINYLVVGSVRQGDEVKNELILFAASDTAIRNHIEMLEEAQLIPVGIDPIPCALFRSFERSLRRHEDREKTVVFVDVGGRFTTVVFGRGEEISFVKEIPIGGERFNETIADKLGITADEAEMLRATLRRENSADTKKEVLASGQSSVGIKNELDVSTRQVIVDAIRSVAQELAREISLCFRYYTVTFRGKRVERAIFSGGQAYENILLNVFKRQLTVEVEIAQPLRGFDLMNVEFDGDRRAFLCEWTVAVGLGLKALAD